jgi:tripeptide aminopeptidase
VYENFNAAAAEIRFTGVTAHPMSAKGVLVNPLLMAADYISHFDRLQTPEHTAGREGYVWFNGIQGDQNSTLLQASIRDFDSESFYAANSRLATSLKKLPRNTRRPASNFRLATPTATSAMPSATIAGPLT